MIIFRKEFYENLDQNNLLDNVFCNKETENIINIKKKLKKKIKKKILERKNVLLKFIR